MEEGINQGCPLSAIFAALVLDQTLRPLYVQLRERARTRLADGRPGDDGMGSISNLFAWIDHVSAAVPLVALKFCCCKFCELARPYLLNLNAFKTRILTSTNGSSIISDLALTDSALAEEIESTIAELSIKKISSASLTSIPVELTEGFRLLGTHIGSPTHVPLIERHMVLMCLS